MTYTFIEDKDSDLFLYFFDGANLYDKEESFIGEVWALDKAIEKLVLGQIWLEYIVQKVIVAWRG